MEFSKQEVSMLRSACLNQARQFFLAAVGDEASQLVNLADRLEMSRETTQKEMVPRLLKLFGGEADASLLDSKDEEVFMVLDSRHAGHIIFIGTEKHNCGAYGTTVDCSCDASWESAMYGCWQQGHQREEEGDPTLAEMTTMKWDVSHIPEALSNLLERMFAILGEFAHGKKAAISDVKKLARELGY